MLNYGARFSRWTDLGKAFVVNYEEFEPVSYDTFKEGEKYYSEPAVEPRVSFSYKTGRFASVKASYNRTLQHINLINNSISPFNTLEVWLPSGPNIKPQKADIYNLGYLQSWPDQTRCSGRIPLPCEESLSADADQRFRTWVRSRHCQPLLPACGG